MEEGKKRDCLVEKMLLFDLDTPKNLLVLGRRNISKDQKIKKSISPTIRRLLFGMCFGEHKINAMKIQILYSTNKVWSAKKIFMNSFLSSLLQVFFRLFYLSETLSKQIGENLTEFQTQTPILYSTIFLSIIMVLWLLKSTTTMFRLNLLVLGPNI